MILLLDHEDSFVFTLARYVEELGEAPMVCRDDALTLEEVRALAPTHIILSPGPGRLRLRLTPMGRSPRRSTTGARRTTTCTWLKSASARWRGRSTGEEKLGVA